MSDANDAGLSMTLAIVGSSQMFWRFTASAVTLTLLDHLFTLSDEVALVWRSRNSLVKYGFLVARYAVLANMTARLIHFSTLDYQTCVRAHHIVWVLAPIVSSACEALIYFHVYAFSQSNFALGVYLAVQYAFVCCGMLAVNVAYVLTSPSEPTTPPLYPTVVCLFQRDTKFGQLMAPIGIASNISLSVITIVIFIKKYRTLQSSLLTSFLQSGMLYLYAIATVNAISLALRISKAPSAAKYVLGGHQQSLYSILACRMILHIRGTSEDSLVVPRHWPQTVSRFHWFIERFKLTFSMDRGELGDMKFASASQASGPSTTDLQDFELAENSPRTRPSARVRFRGTEG